MTEKNEYYIDDLNTDLEWFNDLGVGKREAKKFIKYLLKMKPTSLVKKELKIKSELKDIVEIRVREIGLNLLNQGYFDKIIEEYLKKDENSDKSKKRN